MPKAGSLQIFCHWVVLNWVESSSHLPLLLFSHSVESDSLWSHGLQHARIPCPSPTTRACSNSYPWSQCCHPTISSCFPLLLLPSIFPSIRVFSNESFLCIRWSKYCSFSFSISLTLISKHKILVYMLLLIIPIYLTVAMSLGNVNKHVHLS